MEHIKLNVDDVQGYLASGITLLPFVYEGFLVELSKLQQAGKVSLLPEAVFDLYHIRLTRKLTTRIQQKQKRQAWGNR